jgi:hypothetical protein
MGCAGGGVSTFKRRWFACQLCGVETTAFAWDYDAAPEHCSMAMVETGDHGEIAPAVIDDQLDGGPRRFETLGHDAPYIESKSQLRREAEARGLIPVGDRKPAEYFARQRKRHDEELRELGRNVEY